jgi:hypothetical protein
VGFAAADRCLGTERRECVGSGEGEKTDEADNQSLSENWRGLSLLAAGSRIGS